MDTSRAMGRSPDSLRLDEALAFAGKCVALEIYSPATTPLRRIEAIGDTVEECLGQLVARGLDPRNFEFTRLKAPTRQAA
jgi:hypothetical protein